MHSSFHGRIHYHHNVLVVCKALHAFRLAEISWSKCVFTGTPSFHPQSLGNVTVKHSYSVTNAVHLHGVMEPMLKLTSFEVVLISTRIIPIQFCSSFLIVSYLKKKRISREYTSVSFCFLDSESVLCSASSFTILHCVFHLIYRNQPSKPLPEPVVPAVAVLILYWYHKNGSKSAWHQ